MYTLNKHGAFKISPEQCSSTQCYREGYADFEYDIELKATSLDDNGYVLDSLFLEDIGLNLFSRTPKNLPSCENVAYQIFEDVHMSYMLKALRPPQDLKSISVLVYPAGKKAIAIGYEWKSN